MGFGTEQNSLKTYVNIVQGKLAVQAKEGEEGAISRKNKNGKVVWEKHYPDLEAQFDSIIVVKNDALGAWEYRLELSDIGMKYLLNIPAESKYGDSLVGKLPNIKCGEYIKIAPYDFTDKEGKKRTGVTIIQNGTKVLPAFTKENPNGQPFTNERLDEEEYNIFKIKLRKFYREVVKKYNSGSASIKETIKANNEAKIQNNPDNENLPF